MSSQMKQTNRYFNGTETVRLIVSTEAEVVRQMDKLLGMRNYRSNYSRHPCARNRSEFVRQAIAEKLERESKR